MDGLIDLFKDIKMDVTKPYIVQGIGSYLNHEFEINPYDFLNYAKNDLMGNSLRGSLNALSNSKRSIDCQIDAIYQAIGITNDIETDNIKSFIGRYESINSPINAPTKLKLIQALGMAPTGVIKKVRTLRNKLEHYYKAPTREEVEESIELTELFIGSLQNRMHTFVEEVTIGKNKNLENDNGQFYQCVYINYDTNKKIFTASSFIKGEKSKILEININDKPYLYLIKLFLLLETEPDIKNIWKDLIYSIGYDSIPISNIYKTYF